MILLRVFSFFRSGAFWVAIGFGAFVYLLLPAGVVVMNDDFGYLGTVIETVRRGRPWTDDWLEPWAGSLAVSSAGIYQLTGSFETAIFGVQALGAGAAAAGVYTLLRSRGMAAHWSLAASLLGLTFPTVLWKSVEYTSLVLYIPCLLWAIWAAERRRWILFGVIWLIALAGRQSAITWLAIPTWAAWVSRLQPMNPKSAFLRPAIVAVGGGLAFVVLSVAMNKTQAQAMITDHLWDRVQLKNVIHHLVVGAGTWVVCTGVGAIIVGWRRNGFSVGPASVGRNLAGLTLGACIFALLEFFPKVYFEHGSFDDGAGKIYRNLIVVAGMAGWSMFRFSIRRDFLLAGMGSLLLVCARTDVWDYYFLDLGVFALFGVMLSRHTEPATDQGRWPRVAGLAAGATLACFHGYFSFKQKCRVDRDYAACVLSEQALRKGTLDIVNLGHAPYGFIGWHLHRHFIAHDGKHDADIGGFMRYQQPHATELRWSPMRVWRGSRSLRSIQGKEEPRVLASEIFRVGWFWHQRCSVLRTSNAVPGPAALSFDRSVYQARRFPLGDQEWHQYLDRESDRVRLRLP